MYVCISSCRIRDILIMPELLFDTANIGYLLIYLICDNYKSAWLIIIFYSQVFLLMKCIEKYVIICYFIMFITFSQQKIYNYCYSYINLVIMLLANKQTRRMQNFVLFRYYKSKICFTKYFQKFLFLLRSVLTRWFNLAPFYIFIIRKMKVQASTARRSISMS